MKSILTLIGALLLVPIAWAQDPEILMSPQYQLGEPIQASTGFNAKTYAWECDTAQLIPGPDGRTVYIWAREGKHSLRLNAIPESYDLKIGRVEFEVVRTDPGPSVRSLVTDPAIAKEIGDYFEAISRQVTDRTTATTFWNGYEKTFKWTGLYPKLDDVLKKRLSDALKRPTALSNALRALALEFRGGTIVGPIIEVPEPGPVVVPIVEQGQRIVIIAHESADKEMWFGDLIVDLRKPGTAASEYFKGKGHQLEIMDDELLLKSKWSQYVAGRLGTLPVMFVLDANTKELLKTVPITSATTADNITERVRETGG
jgi:hypothetical protein